MVQHSRSSEDLREPNRRDKEGFRRLAEASLSRAIDDAAGDAPQIAYSAIRWLAGHTQEGLRFEMCCELIGLSPSTVRSSLRLRYKTIRLRFEKYHEMGLMNTDDRPIKGNVANCIKGFPGRT